MIVVRGWVKPPKVRLRGGPPQFLARDVPVLMTLTENELGLISTLQKERTTPLGSDNALRLT
jgi:hypothetical protein